MIDTRTHSVFFRAPSACLLLISIVTFSHSPDTPTYVVRTLERPVCSLQWLKQDHLYKSLIVTDGFLISYQMWKKKKKKKLSTYFHLLVIIRTGNYNNYISACKNWIKYVLYLLPCATHTMYDTRKHACAQLAYFSVDIIPFFFLWLISVLAISMFGTVDIS